MRALAPQLERMKICNELWGANIKAEFGYKPNTKMADSLTTVLAEGIPFMVLFGEDELTKGLITLKDIETKEEVQVKRSDLVSELTTRIASKGEQKLF